MGIPREEYDALLRKIDAAIPKAPQEARVSKKNTELLWLPYIDSKNHLTLKRKRVPYKQRIIFRLSDDGVFHVYKDQPCLRTFRKRIVRDRTVLVLPKESKKSKGPRKPSVRKRKKWSFIELMRREFKGRRAAILTRKNGDVFWGSGAVLVKGKPELPTPEGTRKPNLEFVERVLPSPNEKGAKVVGFSGMAYEMGKFRLPPYADLDLVVSSAKTIRAEWGGISGLVELKNTAGDRAWLSILYYAVLKKKFPNAEARFDNDKDMVGFYTEEGLVGFVMQIKLSDLPKEKEGEEEKSKQTAPREIRNPRFKKRRKKK